MSRLSSLSDFWVAFQERVRHWDAKLSSVGRAACVVSMKLRIRKDGFYVAAGPFQRPSPAS